VIPHFDPATHTFTRPDGSRVLSVTQILAKAGICDYSCVPAEFRDRGLKRGSSVHWMTQLEDQGALNYRTVPKWMRPYRKCWNEYKANTGFKPIAIEYMFAFDDYAGILDRVGTFPPTEMFPNGSHAVLDLKSGNIEYWVANQMGPYAGAWMKSIKLARFIRRVAVRLNGDGSPARVKEFPLADFDRDYSRFVRAKEKANEDHREN